MSLTPKQARFVAEYLVDTNATQAAIRAGYSSKTADVQGPRLLGNAGVREAIAAGTAKIATKLELSAESVLTDIVRIATSAENVGDLSVALKGRELLGRYLKLFTDRLEHSGAVSIGVVDPYAKGSEKP